MQPCFVVTVLLVLGSAVTLSGKQLCLVGDFESQVQYLKTHAMLSPEEIANKSRVFGDLQDTLRRRWRGIKVIPYGSLVTGVALTSSDGDCSVKVPADNFTIDEHFMNEAKSLFEELPEVYTRLQFGTNQKNRLSVFHKPTEMYSDMLFNTTIGLNSSRLFRYFIKLKENMVPLVGIIKLWSRTHQIVGSYALSNFALYSLIIVYLQQKKMAPPVSIMQNFETNETYQWNMSFNEIPYNSSNTENLYQLLGGFYKYYSEFDFGNYIVSPFAGRPIHKSEFADIESIPREFSLYKTYMNKKGAVPLQLNTDLCIQDVFEHNVNIPERVGHEHAQMIISHIKFAARMFKTLPRDDVLRAILVKDQHNEPFMMKKNITVDQISKLEYCVDKVI